MLNIDSNKIPSNRSFGFFFSLVFFIVAIYPLLNQGEPRMWSMIISILFLFLGLLNSKILKPLSKIWLKFGILLGKIVSPVIMGGIFFLLVTTIGFIMRVFKKDLLNLKYNKNKSYWIKKTDSKSNMKDQF